MVCTGLKLIWFSTLRAVLECVSGLKIKMEVMHALTIQTINFTNPLEYFGVVADEMIVISLKLGWSFPIPVRKPSHKSHRSTLFQFIMEPQSIQTQAMRAWLLQLTLTILPSQWFLLFFALASNLASTLSLFLSCYVLFVIINNVVTECEILFDCVFGWWTT